MLLIDRKLAKLKYDAKYASLPKVTKFVKKPFNLTRTRKEKPHCSISYSLVCFIEPVRRFYFCFIEGLAGLTDGLALGRVKLREREVAIGFFG